MHTCIVLSRVWLRQRRWHWLLLRRRQPHWRRQKLHLRLLQRRMLLLCMVRLLSVWQLLPLQWQCSMPSGRVVGSMLRRPHCSTNVCFRCPEHLRSLQWICLLALAAAGKERRLLTVMHCHAVLLPGR